LAVHPALGVNSLAELVALAKQQPGLRYATGPTIIANEPICRYPIDS